MLLQPETPRCQPVRGHDAVDSAALAELAPVPDGPAEAVGAGVLCWRRGRENGRLEVLLVHRPRYDDWSWPKGKPDRGENLTECAVREAAEEVGLQVVLGRPLPPVRYLLPDGRIKQVSYWVARALGHGRPNASGAEVDAAEWVSVEVAAERMAHASDVGPLAALLRFAEEGTLATTAVLIIRHATARPRDAWARADGERPLVASGKRQAMALAALLQCWRPEYVLCSPWRRCMQTMDPYAAASGVRIRTKAGLTEATYRRSPGKAGRHTRLLLESAHGGALCTHRPVLEGVMRAVREWSAPEVAPQVPDANPYLHPGDVLVAHTAHHAGAKPRVVAVERHGTR